jgi:hypothetical protein
MQEFRVMLNRKMLNRKNLALTFGALYIIVGILGLTSIEFISGKGGLLEANTAHHILHLASGVILLVCALQAPEKLLLSFKVVGLVFFSLATLGFVLISNGGMLFGIFRILGPLDHFLHGLLGIVLAAIGFTGNTSKKSLSDRGA